MDKGRLRRASAALDKADDDGGVAVDRRQWERHLANAYRPILKGFLGASVIYNSLIVFANYFTEDLVGFAILGGISAATAIVSFVFLRYLRRQDHVSYLQMELGSLAVYALFYLNMTGHHLLHIDPPKLVFFILLVLAIAASGISLRLIFPCTLVSLATSIWLAGLAGPELQAQFAAISLAGTFVVFAVANLMRNAIKRELGERLRADRLREAAEHAADHDILTGLPNRRKFFRAFRDARRDFRALGLVDLNGFKPINDTLGHAHGDRILAAAGRRISKAVGADGLVARIGGDEFAVLLTGAGTTDVKRTGARIVASIGQTLSIDDREVSLSAAAGFVMIGDEDENRLYEQADYALYQAKKSRGGAVSVFDKRDLAAFNRMSETELQLRVCDIEQEFFVVFHPLMDLSSGRPIGFEALARWSNPALGQTSPDDFIRAAERAGLMQALTPVLLRKALAEARTWPAPTRLAFNLSAHDLMTDLAGSH